MDASATVEAPMDDPEQRHAPAPVRAANHLLELLEGFVYAVVAALLVTLALGVLWRAAQQVPTLFSAPGAEAAALELLDTLLLVFIVVELLFAVRMTLAHRELVAEPFLLVGIIASIKEIVVLSVKAADEIGKGATFAHAVAEIGVLGVLILALGVTAWLLRLKERHPDEASPGGQPHGDVNDRQRARAPRSGSAEPADPPGSG